MAVEGKEIGCKDKLDRGCQRWGWTRSGGKRLNSYQRVSGLKVDTCMPQIEVYKDAYCF